MGCAPSSPQSSQDNDVDLALIDQRMAELYRFKVLLLGAGESGKSTVTKQLKVIHNVEPSADELRVVATSLHQNVLDCMKALRTAAATLEMPLGEEVDGRFERLLGDREEGVPLSAEDAEDVKAIFAAETVAALYARRAEYWLLDSLPYLVEHVARFAEPDFEPTEEDTVMARVRTTGIIESDLADQAKSSSGEVVKCQYKVVDVGGQRNERKKWIHCFDNVSCILFVVNLGGYNQVMFEDSSRNRLDDSIELFRGVANNALFANTPIFLLLNKKDIFEKELEKTPLTVWKKDYDGPSSAPECINEVADAFRAVMPAGKELHLETVTSVYKREIKYAFDDVKQRLFQHYEPSINKTRAELEARRAEIGK